MAIINNTDQIRYTGKGYLDAKMMPVKTVNDLKSISITQRFEGLTITVLNNGNPQDYWLVGGVTNDKWIPKTSNSNFNDLRLVLEEGFLKLFNGENQLGNAVDFNNFFPLNPGDKPSSTDFYIDSVDYTTLNNMGEEGIFMCFTYSNNTKKYLDMSPFLANIYTQGEGIVIDGKIIKIDSAILGRIELLEQTIETHKTKLNEFQIQMENLSEKIKNLKKISADKETIEINEETNELSVKILNKEGNILTKETNELGEKGLYASIPIFYEDEEL